MKHAQRRSQDYSVMHLTSQIHRNTTAKLKANKRTTTLVIGTTGVVLSSGIAYWQARHAPKQQHSKLFDSFPREDDEPQYLTIPQPVLKKAAPNEIKSMIPKHLRKPWKLMHKANTGDYEQHLSAVRELSVCTSSLCDGELWQLAQSCQGHTAIGLARIRDTDLRLFLPPPPNPKAVEESSIPLAFWNVLSKLPSKDVHECIKHFTTMALDSYVRKSEDEFLRDDDLNYEFQRDTHLIMDLPRNRHSEEMVIEYCLVALLGHSTLKSHCQVLLQDTNFLPLLIKILREHPNNNRLKSLIGILTDFFFCPAPKIFYPPFLLCF